MLMDCKKLNQFLNVNGSDFIEIDFEFDKSKSGCAGKMNSFYGKKHTEETKQILRQKTLKLLKSDEFRMSRTNYGDKNGMYGSKRTGELNPMYGKTQSEETKQKISEKAKTRHKNGFVSPKKGTHLTVEQKKSISISNSKTFVIKNPKGDIITIKNLSEYCRTHGLNEIMMSRVSRGIAKKHKGYTTP